jgi:hypothetical protein
MSELAKVPGLEACYGNCKVLRKGFNVRYNLLSFVYIYAFLSKTRVNMVPHEDTL